MKKYLATVFVSVLCLSLSVSAQDLQDILKDSSLRFGLPDENNEGDPTTGGGAIVTLTGSGITVDVNSFGQGGVVLGTLRGFWVHDPSTSYMLYQHQDFICRPGGGPIPIFPGN